VIDILQKHSVNELHVRLTQGVFRHYKWGYPLLSAPTGGEVWAWFKEHTQNIPEKWKGLTNSLAGLLCATFNDVETANSMSPKWNFRPEGISCLTKRDKFVLCDFLKSQNSGNFSKNLLISFSLDG
jgi:GPI-anchor transamidase subunit T